MHKEYLYLNNDEMNCCFVDKWIGFCISGYWMEKWNKKYM